MLRTGKSEVEKRKEWSCGEKRVKLRRGKRKEEQHIHRNVAARTMLKHFERYNTYTFKTGNNSPDITHDIALYLLYYRCYRNYMY